MSQPRHSRCRTAATVLTAGIAIAWAPAPTQACLCLPDVSANQAFEKSSAVFIGVVREVNNQQVEVIQRKVPFPLPSTVLICRFRMEVLAAWKGVTGDDVTVLTGTGGGDCGYDFEMGEVYLVYGEVRSADTVSTNICTRTHAYRDGSPDLADLGPPAIDRTHGKPWGSYRPSNECPIHRKHTVTRETIITVFKLAPDRRAEYQERATTHFPYAGLSIAATHVGGGPVHWGLVCAECRKKAMKWCRKHGGSESPWSTR